MARSPLFISLGALLPILIVPLQGCDSSRFSAARGADTLDAYRRYLASEPKGKNAQLARKRVEVLEYKIARQADRPVGYNTYLRRYPRGKYALACNERLAQIALSRARTPADLRLVLERHEGTPEAREAARRLPGLLAKDAMSRKDPVACRDFLDTYPRAPQATKGRALLARLVFRTLGKTRMELESFAQEFAGTPEATRAMERLRKLLALEVRETRDATLLRELEARFPRAAELKELRAQVLRRRFTAALARADMEALDAVKGDTPEAKEAAALVRWCAARKRRCKQIREQARAAHVWSPAASLRSIQARVFSADLLVSWHAVTTLGWTPGWAAGDMLLELTGSSRLSMVWVAEGALWRWLSRLDAPARSRWIRRLARRPYRKANADEAQRRGALLLHSPRWAEGGRLMSEVSGRTGRILPATYLHLRLLGRARQPAPRRLVARFARSAENRVNALKDAIPKKVSDDNLVTATLAERELFALSKAVEGLGGHDRLSSLRGKVAVLLSHWRVRLARASKTFQPAREIHMEQVDRHRKGRPAALRKLLVGRDPLSRAVGKAICQQDPLPACGAKKTK